MDFLAKRVRASAICPTSPPADHLFRLPVMLSCTGYTGEQGYEIFYKAADAPLIWDTIVAGASDGHHAPAPSPPWDWLRAESYLLFYPTTT